MPPLTRHIPLALSFALTCTAGDHRAGSVTEFKTALSRTKPGDTLTLREGEWKDADLLFEAQGTRDRPITLQAAKPGKTVLTGQSRLRIAGEHLIVSGLSFRGAWHKEDLIQFRRDSKRLSSDCRLTQTGVVDCNSPDGADTHWLGIYGQRNRVDHCWIQGKTTLGTTLVVWLNGQPADHLIDHNYFGPRPHLKKNGAETIRVGVSQTSMQLSRTIVEANCFEQCDGEVEIISNKSCGNIYRGNTFLRCSGTLTLRHGNDCLVEGNYFLGEQAKGSGGVRIIGERHRVIGNYFQDLAGDESRAGLCLVNGQTGSPLSGYFQVKGATITGNSWVNCRQPIYIGSTDSDTGNTQPVQGVVFSRNFVAGKKPAAFIHTPGEVSWEDNIVTPSAAPEPPVPGLRPVEFRLEPSPGGIQMPPSGSPASGYGFAPGKNSPGPLSRSQTGPEWRDG